MNKTGNSDGFESVLFGLIRTLLKPIMNQRGEAGDADDGNPGDALEMDNQTDVQQEGDSSTSSQSPETEGDEGSPAEALNTDQPESTDQQPGESEVDTRFANSPRFQRQPSRPLLLLQIGAFQDPPRDSG